MRRLGCSSPGGSGTGWQSFDTSTKASQTSIMMPLGFPDGKTVLLTQLYKGQRATVLQLPALTGVTVDEAQPHDSTVVSPVVAGLVARAD